MELHSLRDRQDWHLWQGLLQDTCFAGYFTDEEMDNFTKSINTISSEFDNDFERYSVGKMSMEDFNKKYGHLRSGTYDIRTDRYDKMNFRPVSNRRKDQLKITV